MRLLSLQALPNQELSFTFDGSSWRVRIMMLHGRFGADVYRDDEVVVLGTPICPNWPILPFPYMRGNGDFIIIGPSDVDLDYAQFGTSQQLYYFEPAEVVNV